MNLVFNELSVKEEEKDINKAIAVFERFLRTYDAAVRKEIGFSREIYTSVDLNLLQLAEGYYVSKWRNSPGTDRDQARRFRGTNVLIPNISSEQSIQENIDEIVAIKKEEINLCKTAEDLYEKLDVLYPSLLFHQTALDQIRYQLEQRHVLIVSRKLYELEKYFRSWDATYFDWSAFPNRSVAPQTKETLKRFKKEHTFGLKDGREIIVSHHMRYTGNIPGRIYFYPDTKTGKAVICSLTTKLPTISDPKMKIKA